MEIPHAKLPKYTCMHSTITIIIAKCLLRSAAILCSIGEHKWYGVWRNNKPRRCQHNVRIQYYQLCFDIEVEWWTCYPVIMYNYVYLCFFRCTREWLSYASWIQAKSTWTIYLSPVNPVMTRFFIQKIMNNRNVVSNSIVMWTILRNPFLNIIIQVGV